MAERDKREEELKETWSILRGIVDSLRGFIDTDDYAFIERAHRLGGELREKLGGDDKLSGERDLINNLASMYEKVQRAGGSLPTMEHGLLVQQAIYTITRANIMSVGLEFKMKRMKGG